LPVEATQKLKGLLVSKKWRLPRFNKGHVQIEGAKITRFYQSAIKSKGGVKNAAL
jgi:hypothetical protein